MTILMIAIVVFLVILLCAGLSRWLRASSRGQQFPVGPSGPVPMSSGTLNAELLREATAQLNSPDSKQVNAILKSMIRKRYDEALDAIERMLAIQHHPDVQTLLLWTKSNIYQRTRRTQEEIVVLMQLCALRSHPLFELNLGIANSRLKKYQEAEDHYMRAIEIMNGRYPLATFNLGIMYCDVGRRSEASKQLRALEVSAEAAPAQLVEKLRRRVSELR